MIEIAKRRIKFRSPTCSDRCISFGGYLWITSEWVNLELDPRRYLHLIPPSSVFPSLTQACLAAGPTCTGRAPGPDSTSAAPLLSLCSFSQAWAGHTLPLWSPGVLLSAAEHCWFSQLLPEFVKFLGNLPGCLILLLEEGERSGLVWYDLSHLICLSLLHGYRLPGM